MSESSSSSNRRQDIAQFLADTLESNLPEALVEVRLGDDQPTILDTQSDLAADVTPQGKTEI